MESESSSKGNQPLTLINDDIHIPLEVEEQYGT